MFHMLRNFWTMFASLFSSLNRTANALDIMAMSLEEAATGYVDEQRFERAKKMYKLQQKMAAAKSSGEVA